MSKLVEKLSNGTHAVEMIRYETTEALKEAIEREYVLVSFVDTKGGTEVGFSIDKSQSSIDITEADDPLKLVGSFKLDYVDVVCQVEIDPHKRTGTGNLSIA